MIINTLKIVICKSIIKLMRNIKYTNIYLDKLFVKAGFFVSMGYELDLDNVVTFNEKLQYLKIHDRNPEYSQFVDKIKAKEYIKALTNNRCKTAKVLGIYNNFRDIDFNTLPNQFAIKCTHDSGSYTICKDKSALNLKSLNKKYKNFLSRDFFLYSREFPYKGIVPKIIIEEYLCNDNNKELSSQELTDYKFYCFDGQVECVMVCYDRQSGDPKFYFFDQKWNLLRINQRGKNAPQDFSLKKPDNLEEMFDLASYISRNIPFVRVDLYEQNNEIYFGEMTFYPQSGFDRNYLPDADIYFGKLINLDLVYDKKRMKDTSVF